MLTDCASRESADSELLIVQADLADSVKQGRDRLTQAVLPVGPSIIKLGGAELDEVLLCDEIMWIIASLGVGIWLPDFPGTYNLGALRYLKVIIWTDATPDGRYIREQLLALFTQIQLPLLEAGRVYEVPHDWTGEVMMVSEAAIRVKAPGA